MSSIEHFFEFLNQQRNLLDNSPFLDANDQRGLESSYCLFHDIIKHSSRNRRDKARQHLKNVFSIAKPLFVLVAVTISVSDLALLEHKELFPRLETWWENHLPSPKFQSRAIELINELDHEKERGGLIHVQNRTSQPFEVDYTNPFQMKNKKQDIWEVAGFKEQEKRKRCLPCDTKFN